MTGGPGARAGRRPRLSPEARIWLSAGSASVGDGLRLAALPLAVAALTRDPLQVAGLTVAQRVPALLLALPAGVVLDRVDAYRTLVVCQRLRVALMLLLAGAVASLGPAASGRPALAAVYVLAALLASVEAFGDVAAQVAVQLLIADERLEHTNARVVAGQMLGEEFLGPPAGGWLFGLGRWPAFVGASLTYALSSLLLGGRTRAGAGGADRGTPEPAPQPAATAGATPPGTGTATETAAGPATAHAGGTVEGGAEGTAGGTAEGGAEGTAGGGSRRGILSGIAGEAGRGLAVVVRSRPLLAQALWTSVMNAGNGMVSAVFVLFALEELHLGGAAYGLLLTAGGIGGVLGAAVAGAVSRVAPRSVLMVTTSSLASLCTLALGVARDFAAVFAAQAVAACCGVLFSVVARSFRQSITPARYAGRTTAIYRLLSLGSVPLGALLGGVLAGTGTPGHAITAAGALMLLGTLAAAPFLRHAPKAT
ncbi:MFS transporter [Streptomyces hoynatensis]|uniref:Major facilitator superfamily (MFS) profile domain-containing protein n=1 Tax=Streptomyces hoynatensis TaxID=1141874 RepID=A0A3A9ZEW6_9ACTN|nr:MFS transporter [Streptomyces hoynatensis]RKN47012.1 hypothetical protein D7294_02170 [Streptomyces hoynatensis]